MQSSIREECLVDPADLDLEYGCEEPDLCFSRSQVRDPAYALLDSGCNWHVLLPGHMLPKGARSFEVTVNLAAGKEKAKCWRNEVYAQERAHPLLPLGRIDKFSRYKQFAMQTQENGMTKLEIRNNMAQELCEDGFNKLTRIGLQLAVLGKSSTGSEDEFISETAWCESD